jgi:hypothetical protein
MFSLLKLIDKSIVIGYVTHEGEHSLTIENPVEIGVRPRAENFVEQYYYIKGMWSPFTISNPIQTEVYKEHVISFQDQLDAYLEDQYNRYIKNWYGARKLKDSFEEALPEVNKEDIETLEALLQRQALANNEIH